MDASRLIKNRRGLAIVYVALLLTGLVAIAGLVIDLSYMFVNRTKLQNAADAGALAGAGRLNLQPLANLTGARNGAKQFADVNFSLTLDPNTTNDPGGDIVLGHWNRAATPPFNPSGTPVNAVKVVTRRTGATGTGVGANTDFNLFLGNVIGVDKMGAKASAIAYRPPRARTYFMVGRNVCNMTPPVTLAINEGGSSNMAWTTLSQANTNANDVKDNFFCPPEKLPFEEVCNTSIFATGGNVNAAFQAVEVDFYDPTYDAASKTFILNGVVSKTYSPGSEVYTWSVVTPVSFDVDPTIQPVPQPVWGYATMTLTRACGTGGGNPCNAENRQFTAPNSAGCIGNEIVFGNITCTDCANSANQLGAKPVLAQ